MLFDGFAYGYGTTREPLAFHPEAFTIAMAPLEPISEYLVVSGTMYRVSADRVRSGRERMVC